MASALFEKVSLQHMCDVCRTWPAVQRGGLDLKQLLPEWRKSVALAVQSVVALPERLNTECCVELVYNASRLVLLVTPDSWLEYSFMFQLASRQLCDSLCVKANAERWLAYHAGGLRLVEEELLKLLGLLRDAPTLLQGCLTRAEVTLSRALCCILIRNLLPATYTWQDEETSSRWWCDAVGSLFPSKDGVCAVICSVLEDCRQQQRFAKRGLMDSKAEQDAMYAANGRLRHEALLLLSASLQHPVYRQLSRPEPTLHAQAVSRCFGVVVSISREVPYKQRDVVGCGDALHCLCLAVQQQFFGTIATEHARSVLKDASAGLFSVTAPRKDAMKTLWMEASVGKSSAVVFPLWDAVVVRRMVQLASSVGARHPDDASDVVSGLLRAGAPGAAASLAQVTLCAREAAWQWLLPATSDRLPPAVETKKHECLAQVFHSLFAFLCDVSELLPVHLGIMQALVVLCDKVCLSWARSQLACQGSESAVLFFEYVSSKFGASVRQLCTHFLALPVTGESKRFAAMCYSLTVLRLLVVVCGLTSVACRQPTDSFMSLQLAINEARDMGRALCVSDDDAAAVRQEMAMTVTAIWKALSTWAQRDAQPDAFMVRLNDLLTL